MQKAAIIIIGLSLLASLGCILLGEFAWCGPLWIGSLWGFANFWCMERTAATLFSGSGNFRLVLWLVGKFVLLYGVIAWLLVGVRISPLGWLAGFSLSLVGFGIGALDSFRPVRARLPAVRQGVRHLLVPVVFFLFQGSAYASQAAQGEAPVTSPPEIPNLITLITHFSHGPVSHFLHTWENSIYALVIALIIGGLFTVAARVLAIRPGRGQMFAEMIIEGLDDLVSGVLGKKEGRRYLPFLGTLFIYILGMNLAGLIPGFKSPTSRIEMTMALGFCVFVFVQWTGIQRLGVWGYVDHFLGQPRDAIGWILAPLMLFIHGIGEIVKPISLALRLFGNIMGEDTLLGVFVVLGAMTFAWSKLPIGLPLHLPFVLLAIIFSTVQALVFTMLSSIYIFMMLPHEEGQH